MVRSEDSVVRSADVVEMVRCADTLRVVGSADALQHAGRTARVAVSDGWRGSVGGAGE